jgi:hypothetical protein
VEQIYHFWNTLECREDRETGFLKILRAIVKVHVEFSVNSVKYLDVNALYLNFFKEQLCDLFVKAFDVNALDLKLILNSLKWLFLKNYLLKKVKDTVKVQVLWLNACLKLFQWITVAFKAGECLEYSEPPADPEENWWCSLLSMVSS